MVGASARVRHTRGMTYPHKKAPVDFPIIDAIAERWSPLAFDPKPVEEEKIRTMFEAARWAPSAYNEQPWRFVWARKGDKHRETLESLLVQGNSWAKNAGVLILSFSKKTFGHNGNPNRHHLHDLGAASAYLVEQATALGLVTHQMSGYDAERANEALGVPADFEPGSMIAVGEYAGQDALDEGSKKREESPRVRKTLDEIAFNDGWKA